MKLLFLILAIYFQANLILAQDQQKLLEHAYKTKSKKELKQFFDNWHKEIPPISDFEFANLSDLQKETYKVFEAFYHPENLKLLGGSEWGDSIYFKASYLLVQNSIKIYNSEKICKTYADSDSAIVKIIKSKNDTSWDRSLIRRSDGHLSQRTLYIFRSEINSKAILTDSISDFRPVISCGDKISLNLIDKYYSMISDFLENQYDPLGTVGLMNPAKAIGISADIEKFLNNYIKIWYGHWGGYWQLISYPEVISITFDKTLTCAKIDFRMVYEGGTALLIKENGTWRIVSSKLTWIE